MGLDCFWNDSFPRDAVDFISKKNAVPVIRWFPVFDDSTDVFSYEAINQGIWDEHIGIWADSVKNAQIPVVMALFADSNREEVSAATLSHDIENFAQAFRRVVYIFDNHNARNVVWVYQLANDFGSVSANRLVGVYPGDDVVDWLGMSVAYTPGSSFTAEYAAVARSLSLGISKKPVMLTLSDFRPFPDYISWMVKGLTDAPLSSTKVGVVLLDVPDAFPFEKLSTVFQKPAFQTQ